MIGNIQRENPIARTNNAAMGNSRTALRQAADADDRRRDGLMSSVVVDALTGSPGIATGLNLARNVLGQQFRALGQRLNAAGEAQRSGEILRLLGGQDQAAVQARMDQLAQRRDFLRRANAISAPSLIAGLAAGRVAGGLLAGPDDPRRGVLDR